jgi:hypothetical protein
MTQTDITNVADFIIDSVDFDSPNGGVFTITHKLTGETQVVNAAYRVKGVSTGTYGVNGVLLELVTGHNQTYALAATIGRTMLTLSLI